MAPTQWLFLGGRLSLAFALTVCAVAAPGCGGDYEKPPLAGLAATIVGEWRPSEAEVERVAAKRFPLLRRTFPLKAPGDEKVSDLAALLSGLSPERVEQVRMMTDPELLAYARGQVSAESITFLAGGTAEYRRDPASSVAPATWHVDGADVVVKATLGGSSNPASAKTDAAKISFVVRFQIVEGALVMKDAQVDGKQKDPEEGIRTWQRGTGRGR